MNWRPTHLWRKLLTGVLTITLGWLVFLAVSIVRFAGKSDPGPADAAIVLGAAVTDNAPTPVFEQRIQHAVDLYHAGTVRVLILTGGVGAGDTLAESEVARRYCLAHGVAAQDLLIETQSHSTRDNVEQARRLLAEHGLKRALIVRTHCTCGGL